MVSAGWSPSVRLFEAAAIGTPIISDAWPGLEAFFVPGKEILIADSPQRVAEILAGLSEAERGVIAAAARRRVLRSHTLVQRAMELERYLDEVRTGKWQGLPEATVAATGAAE
jgi:spore maturation protein CgeB